MNQGLNHNIHRIIRANIVQSHESWKVGLGVQRTRRRCVWCIELANVALAKGERQLVLDVGQRLVLHFIIVRQDVHLTRR